MNITEKILRAKDDYDAVYEAGKKAVVEVLKFIDVSSNSYRSTVPNGVEPFARVNEIGCMTYKIGNELRSAKVSELKSEGANLIRFPYIDAVGFEIGVPIEKNGLTITVNEDRSIKVVGTATNETYINLCQVNFGEKSAFGGGAVNGFYFTHCQYNAANLLTYVTIGKGVPIDRVYYPMVNRGTTALPYKPYVGTLDTLAIPEAVKSIEGYGQGNPDDNSEYNYIDFNRKVFVSFGHITDEGWVRYETPIETDISAYLTDEYIEVEGGGTITAVNEYGYDAPTNISYIVDTQGG